MKQSTNKTDYESSIRKQISKPLYRNVILHTNPPMWCVALLPIPVYGGVKHILLELEGDVHEQTLNGFNRVTQVLPKMLLDCYCGIPGDF